MWKPVVVKWEGYTKRIEMSGPINKRTVARSIARILGIKKMNAPFTYKVESITRKNPVLTMFDVYKGRKLIDTIPYSGKTTAADIKKSLVNHDGYDPDIVVKKRRQPRKSWATYPSHNRSRPRNNPRRKTRAKTRKTKRNATMATGKKMKLGKLALIGAGIAAAWYFLSRRSSQLRDPLPITALRDPSRPVGSTGQSYNDREQNRANAVEAAKYLKPGISDAKAKEVADAMMRSGLMRSYAQRTLSVSEWTNLQPFRNVLENLTK